MARKLTELEESIVVFSRERGCLAELCVLVNYEPDAGQVPEYWVPRQDVLQLAQHLADTK